MADETREDECLIEMDLGPNGGRIRIRSYDEFTQWLEREQEFWKWLGDDKSPDLAFLRNHFRNEFNEAKKIGAVTTDRASSDTTQQMKGFFNKYKKRHLIYSETPDANFVASIKDAIGLFEALSTLSLLVVTPNARNKGSLDIDNIRTWHGIVDYILLTEGVSKQSTAAYRNTLENLSLQYMERLRSDAAAADNLKGQFQELIAEYRDVRERDEADRARFAKVVRRLVRKKQSAVRKELDDFRNLLADGISLGKPVDYWRDKALRHATSMKRLFWSFAIYIAAMVVIVGCLVRGTGLADLTFWENVGIQFVALTLASLGVVVAGARVLYKLAMMQLHLRKDAEERVTMVQVYLALRERKHANENHMTIVLERLFAPASDGVVKDDLVVTLPDVLKTAVARK